MNYGNNGGNGARRRAPPVQNRQQQRRAPQHGNGPQRPHGQNADNPGIDPGFRRQNDRARQNPNYRRDDDRRRPPRDNRQHQNRQEDRYRREGDDNERNQGRGDRCMGFRVLEEIAGANDEDVIIKLNEKKTSFINLLESAIDKGDIFVLIIEVISKVCLSSFQELKLKLLLEICNSRFIVNFQNYLVNLPYTDIKSKNNLYWNDQKRFWINFIKFCDCIISLSPSTALQKCRSLVDAISKCSLEGLNSRHGFVLDDEYNIKLSQLRERLIICEVEEKESKTRRNYQTNINENMEPPEDFRELSVVPQRDDLLETQPFLRPNIVNGGYRDVDHYLDVQFRLLREDCFGPLRDGIAQFIENPSNHKFDNIRVYKNVKFIEPYISANKFGEIIQLDEKTIKRFKKINWAHSKRFIFGSLLLFTKDNCRTFITATILERDIKLLGQGKIPVSIVDKVAGNNIFNNDSYYTMIESEVYYEPYFHVLKALQETSFPEHLAMKKYIVDVDTMPNPPRYLNDDTTYRVKTEYGTVKLRVLDPMTWPSKEELSLNESQYEAYNLALTHEFAVLQGPPGTGKTFLGVKIAKTLIENLSEHTAKCLMLIICYTNHALDQFLEHLLPITNSIVRIGGQSRNEAMERLNLTTLRKTTQLNFNAKRLFYEERNNLKLSVREMQRAQERLDNLNNGIISYNSLKDYVPEVQLLGQYYEAYRKNVQTDPLKHWLFEQMQYVDFEDIFAEVNTEQPNDENNVLNFENDIRIEMILDEFEEFEQDWDLNDQEDAPITTSFTVTHIESKLKTLISLHSQISDRNKKLEIQREIVDLKSHVNLFNEMRANRTEAARLVVNRRTAFGVVSLAQRWALYFRWASVVTDRLKQNLKTLQENLDSASTAYEEARMMIDLKILNNIKVVGMTTSGAARLRKLLQALAPSIVIVEEAAEVLEQHIVTSLTKDCEHLILIGDHQQLRPSAAHMRLARHFNLEISLFERMITNGMHSRRLGVQHRMRPELAALISPHIYADLQNHSSVRHFPSVRGVTGNLFFLTHNYKEEEVDDSSSRSNKLEADMTLKLANYLMQQGYEPDDVTILAAYSGQMFYMRKQREKYAFLTKVKITVVDNYQGEESKIILLSLVRNNDQNKIGFLGTENRVCVALSRAREGFYMFGNIEMLKRKSELWTKIATTLDGNGSLGAALILKCERHQGQITAISSPKDFDKVPEGGCLLKCDYNLPCGHLCPLVCHGYDRDHINTKCYMKCERVLCERSHVCPLLCSVKCQPCKRLVLKGLPCGHNKEIYCYLEPTDPTVKCLTKVTVKLPKCGHEVQKSCYMNINSVKCPVPCVFNAKCGHACTMKCHVDDDPDHQRYLCQKPCPKAKAGCTANLVGDRGDHQCRKKCYEPCDDCTVEVIKKRSTCKHTQRIQCNKDLDEILCKKNCARVLSCGHFCKKKCHEPCNDCTQKVTKTIEVCNHKIDVMCKTPATHDLCREKCERKMECGHVCTGPCADACDYRGCTQLVDKEFMAPCGHRVKLPCNVYNQKVWSDKVLLQHCTAPCLQELACGHHCGGSCADCHQGRLHAPCTQPCQQLNICGHQCNEPCNQACPPCNKTCGTKCVHSRCNKTCGAPCTPCQEACERSCRHGSCKNRCGEPCSRPPCEDACEKTLPCGHHCRGLCGEPCPDICNVCRSEQFPTDFLGDPFEDDVKFIRLEDCSHVLDVENMDNLMMGDKESITIRKCPFCRTPIVNTPRYKDFINHMFRTEINPVKERVYGNENIIKKRREELFIKILEFNEEYEDVMDWNTYYLDATLKLHKTVKTQKKASLLKLEMQFQYLEILDMIGESYRKYRAAQLTELHSELHELVQIMCSALVLNLHKISQQFQHDMSNEIKRMNSMIQLAKILSHTSYISSKMLPKVKTTLAAANQAVLTWGVFDQKKAVVVLKEFQEAVAVSGIVTKEERDLIVKAIGSKSGSWYKCPNGHIYSIAQCGGAMEISKCADCGAAIGGTSHTLLESNAHAGEVDGSRFAAWSNQYNNLANWQF